MQAAELRVGNLLLKHFSETEMMELEAKPIVVAADAKTIYDLAYYPDEFQKRYEPIPLTEEWLLKFDFEDLRHSGEQLFELIHNDIIGYRFSMEGQYGYPEIKYVHQLQNLYFALTDEELEIEEPATLWSQRKSQPTTTS